MKQFPVDFNRIIECDLTIRGKNFPKVYNFREVGSKKCKFILISYVVDHSLKMIFHFSFFISLLIFFTSCSDVRRDQYVAEGYELFKANCANCHQEKGSGLEGLYPVIVKEYLVNNQKLACMIKNGMNQPIVVNGKNYSRPMPANLQLKDLEIAEIMTFLQNQYKVSEQITPTDSVVVWLQKCN